MSTVKNSSNDFLTQLRQKIAKPAKKSELANSQQVAATPVRETEADAFVSKTKKDNKTVKTAGIVALALATAAGVAYGLNIKNIRTNINGQVKKLFHSVMDKIANAKSKATNGSKGVNPDGFGKSKPEALVRGPKPPKPVNTVTQQKTVQAAVTPQVQQAAAPVKPKVQQVIKPKQETVMDAAKKELEKRASVDTPASVNDLNLLQQHFGKSGKVQ